MLIVNCPDCAKLLSVPDRLLGKTVRCPGCRVMFKASVAGDKGRVETPPRPARGVEGEAAPGAGIDTRPGTRPGAGRRDDERAAVTTREDQEDERRPPRRQEDDGEDARRRSRRGRAEEEEDEDDLEEPRTKRKARNSRAGWKKVRTGLGLVAIAGWVQVGIVGVLVLGGLVFLGLGISLASAAASAPNGPAGPGGPPPGVLATGTGMVIVLFLVMGFAVLANLAENALRLIGMWLCLAVPRMKRSSAQGLAIAAFCFAAGSVALVWLGNVVSWASQGLQVGPQLLMSGGGSDLSKLGLVARLVAFVVFLFFLRNTARAVRDERLAQAVTQLMIAYGTAVGVIGGLTVVVGAVLRRAGASLARTPSGAELGAGVFGILALVFQGVAALIYLGLYIRYLLLVQEARDAVDDHVHGR
jgi:hypothetical protein